MTWQVYVRDFQVLMDNEILRPYSAVTLSADTLPDLLRKLDTAVMCNGNFDSLKLLKYGREGCYQIMVK